MEELLKNVLEQYVDQPNNLATAKAIIGEGGNRLEVNNFRQVFKNDSSSNMQRINDAKNDVYVFAAFQAIASSDQSKLHTDDILTRNTDGSINIEKLVDFVSTDGLYSSMISETPADGKVKTDNCKFIDGLVKGAMGLDSNEAAIDDNAITDANSTANKVLTQEYSDLDKAYKAGVVIGAAARNKSGSTIPGRG